MEGSWNCKMISDDKRIDVKIASVLSNCPKFKKWFMDFF